MNDRLRHKKGWVQGDVIQFYYIPDEHRVMFTKPARYKEFIELVPKNELNQLQVEKEELLRKFNEEVDIDKTSLTGDWNYKRGWHEGVRIAKVILKQLTKTPER